MMTITTCRRLAVLGTVLAGLCLAAAADADSGLTIPKGYRQWFMVNSMIVDKASPLFDPLGGMHIVSVNAKGLAALRSGGTYADGSIFIDDIHDVTEAQGISTEGPRKVIAIMYRDAKKYASTGGWGFQIWVGGDPKKPLVTDAAKQCFFCHAPHDDHQYVISTYIP
ncbi:MAG TPA: cytochrome P460 family protein [Stellaceae bacterium]|nr:cytochrome P460 family protein [Stellaceae bacterium]